MLGQLKEQQLGRGLILTNGEFGERLHKQAQRWSLDFDVMEQDWGMEFDKQQLDSFFQTNSYSWLLAVHGETSTGTCNDLETLVQLTKRYNVKLCVDCISSFGAMSFSLKECYLATAVSGKALGALSGLAFVFFAGTREAVHDFTRLHRFGQLSARHRPIYNASSTCW